MHSMYNIFLSGYYTIALLYYLHYATLLYYLNYTALISYYNIAKDLFVPLSPLFFNSFIYVCIYISFHDFLNILRYV